MTPALDPHAFLRDLVVVLGTAAVTTVLFQRLRQPVVLGYLLAGMLVGPHVPIPLVADTATVQTLAELGVILLMFALGLEFSLRRLVKLGPGPLLVCAVEVGAMLTLGSLTARALGWSPLASVFAGGVVAISSTMIIARVFEDTRDLLPLRVRELVVAVLVGEDLVAILLITTLGAAAAGAGLSAREGVGILGRLALFLGLVLAAGALVVPRAVRAVARFRRDETLLVTSVALSFGLALVALGAGYSVALGAFLAGALVAESGASHRVLDLVRPLRDLFSAIFFVAVGMLIDPRAVAAEWSTVLILAALVLGGKVLAVTAGATLAGYGLRPALQAGIALGQIGEFSFIIAGIGVAAGAVPASLSAVAVAVSAITSFCTPWLVRGSGRIAMAVDRRLPHRVQRVISLYGSWVELLGQPQFEDRPGLGAPIRRIAIDGGVLLVLAIGGAVTAPVTARALAAGLGMAPEMARWVVLAAGAAIGAPFVIGLGRTTRMLGQALAERALPRPPRGVDQAKSPRTVLARTLQLATLLAVGAPMVALSQPFLPPGSGLALLAAATAALTLGLWRSATDLEGHAKAGAELVVHVLAKHAAAGKPLEDLDDAAQLLPGLGVLIPVRIAERSPAAGRTLAELNLRGLTGATVVAIARGSERIPNPDATVTLNPGDIVALSGTSEAVSAGAAVLLGATAEMAIAHS